MSRSCKPAGKKTRVAAGPSTKTKRVNSAARVNEFPNESLTVSLGKIYCNACHLVLSSKKSIIKNHVTTVRHKKGKEDLEETCIRQHTLSENWATYQKTNAPDCAGAGLLTIPEDVAKRRVDVVEAFLTAGVPLAKVIYLRPLLEAGNLRLTDRAHLAQYIPFLTEVEMKRLKEEFIGANYISVIFAGSTHQGEALAVILRCIDREWKPLQSLVSLRVLAKSVDGAELACELLSCLSTLFQLKPNQIIAFIRDGAAVNKVAVTHLTTFLHGKVLDVICLSHSLDNVGRRFETPVLGEFLHWWVSLFARSPAARLQWKARSGVAPKTHCSTRWWSLYEVAAQSMELFGDIQPFLEECTYSPSACQHLISLFDRAEDEVKVELAATIDAVKVFCQKTYTLEGDGMLATEVYSHL